MPLVAKPIFNASAALNIAPVMPKNSPILLSILLRNQLAPTSGYKPMVISGIASKVFSVTTL